MTFKNIVDPSQALFQLEQSGFGAVVPDPHDDLVKQRQAALNDIHVADGDRVKGAGE
jgi:hypothetical protein